MKRIYAFIAIMHIGVTMGATRPPVRPATPYPVVLEDENPLDRSLCQSYCAVQKLIQTTFTTTQGLWESGINIDLQAADKLDPVDDQTKQGIVLMLDDSVPTTIYFELGRLRFARNWAALGNANILLKDALLREITTRRIDAPPGLFSYAKSKNPTEYYEVRLVDVYGDLLPPAEFKQNKNDLMPALGALRKWRCLQEKYKTKSISK